MCTYLYSYQVKINVTVCCVGNGNFFVVGFWMDFFMDSLVFIVWDGMRLFLGTMTQSLRDKIVNMKIITISWVILKFNN